jgi:hypothetical protein
MPKRRPTAWSRHRAGRPTPSWTANGKAAHLTVRTEAVTLAKGYNSRVTAPAPKPISEDKHRHRHHAYAAEATGLLLMGILLLILILVRYWSDINWSTH